MGFLYFRMVPMGLRLAALRAAGAPLLANQKASYAIVYVLESLLRA